MLEIFSHFAESGETRTNPTHVVLSISNAKSPRPHATPLHRPSSTYAARINLVARWHCVALQTEWRPAYKTAHSPICPSDTLFNSASDFSISLLAFSRRFKQAKKWQRNVKVKANQPPTSYLPPTQKKHSATSMVISIMWYQCVYSVHAGNSQAADHKFTWRSPWAKLGHIFSFHCSLSSAIARKAGRKKKKKLEKQRIRHGGGSG